MGDLKAKITIKTGQDLLSVFSKEFRQAFINDSAVYRREIERCQKLVDAYLVLTNPMIPDSDLRVGKAKALVRQTPGNKDLRSREELANACGRMMDTAMAGIRSGLHVVSEEGASAREKLGNDYAQTNPGQRGVKQEYQFNGRPGVSPW